MRKELRNAFKRNTLSRKLTVLCAVLVLASLSHSSGAQPTGAPESAVDPLPTGFRELDETLAKLERFDASGKVVDLEGNPVPRAQVYAYFVHGQYRFRDRFVGRTTTDETGLFKFEKAVVWEPELTGGEQRPQRYSFVAKHPELGIDFETRLKGDPTDNITITLSEVVTYEIKLEDLEGNPIPGAHVYLSSGEHQEAHPGEYERYYNSLSLDKDIGVSSGETDEEGRIELMGLPPGRFWFDKEGYTRIWGRGTVGLFDAVRVSGKVNFEDGTPAAGVAVQYIYHGQRLFCDQVTVSDKEGNYVFNNAPGSGYYFWWLSDAVKQTQTEGGGHSELKAIDFRPGSSYVGKSITFDVSPGDKVVKDLTVNRGFVLSGTVSDLVTGEPVPNMVMRLLIETGRGNLDTKDASADENGAFSVTVAPGTSVRLSFEESRRDGNYLIDEEWRRQQGNYYAYRGTVTEDITDMDVKVKLLPARQVTGRVLDDQGHGVKSAMVHVHSDLPAVKTDDNGAFTLKTVPKGDGVELFAISEDEELAALVRLNKGDTEAAIALEPTQDYDGQVLNAEGLPAGNLVFYLDVYLNGRAHYRVRQEPEADVDGKFAVENLCPKATYYAWWSSDDEDNRDYDYGNATIDISKLEPGNPITFEAKEFLNALMGRVVNDKGEPIDGARIQVTSWQMLPQDVRNEQITSDKNGEFVVERLAAGEVTLMIRAEGYKARSATAPTDSVDFETVLSPLSEGTGYRITVVDDEGNPVPSAPLTLLVKLQEEGKETAHSDTAVTDGDGKAEFSFKPAGDKVSGRGILGCDLEGYDLAYRGVRLNEDVEGKLVLHSGGDHWSGQVLDENGKPFAGAEVKVIGMRQGHLEGFPATAFFREVLDFKYTTDAEGRFELARFDKRDLAYLQVSASGYAIEEKWLTPDQDEESIFSLSLAAILKGTVIVKETGKPESTTDASIVVCGGGNRRCERGENGTFFLDDLVPGQYNLWYLPTTPEGRKYVCASPPSFTAAPGETVEITLEIEEGIPVRGKFVDAKTGEALKGWKTLMAFRASNRYDPTVDEDGTWEIYLPEGEIDLQYSVEGMGRYQSFKTFNLEKGKAYEGFVIEVNTDGT